MIAWLHADEDDDDADDDASVDICQTFPDHSPISAHSFAAKKSQKLLPNENQLRDNRVRVSIAPHECIKATGVCRKYGKSGEEFGLSQIISEKVQDRELPGVTTQR